MEISTTFPSRDSKGLFISLPLYHSFYLDGIIPRLPDPWEARTHEGKDDPAQWSGSISGNELGMTCGIIVDRVPQFVWLVPE